MSAVEIWPSRRELSSDHTRGGSIVGTLNLPQSGVFALEADTFQRYFVSYGWVS